MVSFICDACGNTVKKNQVEKHYQTQCRNCNVLSCIDCGVDFPGDSYVNHTSCITEAEKYQGHLYQAKDKENKGEAKQKEWTKQLQGVTDTIKDPRLKSLLGKISEYSNVPRKKKKFENFCKNSIKVYDEKTLNQLWNAFNNSNSKTQNDSVNIVDENTSENDKRDDDNTDSTEEIPKSKKNKKSKLKENGDVNGTKKSKKSKKHKLDEDEETEAVHKLNKTKKKNKKNQGEDEEITEQENGEEDEECEKQRGRFHWHKTVKNVLKDADEHQLSIKKLRKKVLSAYQEHGLDHRASTIEESLAFFDKKLHSYPKVKISKDVVKLVK